MRKPLPGHLAFREAVKNKTNKNEKKKNSNLSITVFNAADRNRTGTGITTHGILSPGRLPVPPLRHILFSYIPIAEIRRIRASTVALSRYLNGCEGGFEPPKASCQQIYSLSPLATRESAHGVFP